jgi:hypothetical protein
MLLDFHIDKAIAATAYLIERQGGADSMFYVLKKLYYADRTALIRWGAPITGDEFASLKKGPVVSGIYDLLKGKGTPQDLKTWNEVIDRRGNTIRLKKQADQGLLSEREKEVLDESRRTIEGIKSVLISTWLHEHCPEWEDPGDSSIPIDPSTILRKANKTEEEIRRIEHANEELRTLSRLLGTR